MATDVQLLENRLAEYEHKARAVCIGVNQLALGTERIQQDDLLRQVKHLEEELKRLNQQKTGLHKRALDVRNDVKGNAAALRYLETISQLERSFTVLTENVTETSVQLSSPKALPESVHVKKDLGDNVQSCWNYVTQLSRLTQVHIHNAAEYQQFHHALSKVEANLNKRLRMTHPDHMRQLPEELSSAPMIANELRDHLNHFIHLWTETGHLIEESRRIVPVHLRLGGVKNGVSINTESSSPVMARALLPLAGPNYELDEGEAVRIINNSDDPHSWKVHTSSGIAEIPSVSLWISDPDVEAMKRAIVVRERCVETWEVVVERMRERLRVYYTHLLSQMAERGTIYYSSKNVMQHLLADLDNFDPSTDVAGLELRRSLNLFQEQLQLIPRGSQPPSGITLREQDIVSMHSPLLRFRDHEHQMANLGVQSQFLGKHLTSYLQQIDSERRRVDEELAVMGSLQRDQQAQLDHLIGRVRRWSSRYDGRAPLEFSIHDSMGSSSIHSSTHSDQRLEAKTGFTDHTARIDTEHVRPTSSQQKSLIDVITQIGVDTNSAVCQTDLSFLSQSMVDPGPQTISEFRAIHVEESTRGTTIGSGISVGPVLQRLPLVASSPPKREVFDAICQIGLVQGTTHTQTDRGMGLHSTVFQTDSVSLPSRTTADTICQVGSISRSTAVQAVESFISPQLPVLARAGFDVGCQAELIAQPHTKVPLRVQVARPLQALPSRSKQNAAATQADLIPPRMPTVNVLVQTGILTNWKTTQTDPGIEPEFVARSFTSRQHSTPISGYADYAMWTGSQGSSMSHTACQIGVVRTEKQCQTEMAEPPRSRARSVDVRSQTAMSPPASRAKSHDVLTQVGIVQESRGLQFEAPVPAAMSLPIRASTSDVQIQIGVVRKGKETQTEKEERLDGRMVDKPLERFDVEVQNGVRGISDWCQTEEMVLPMKKHYDVQLQSGIRNISQALQTDIEVVTVLKRFDVETQSGVRDKPEWCQTDMAIGKKADVYDVAVDANLRPKLKDYSFETESLPELELVAPVQLARPPEPQNDKGVQASSLTTSCDVELQSGIRANSMSVQTDMGAPIIAPKKYNAEIQSGIRNKTDWTQTDMASVSTSSAMTHTPPSPKPNDYACETDAPLEVTRVEQVRMAPTWTSKEEMGVQAEYVSTRYDVQLQSGIRTRADETQTDDFLDVQVYAPVRSVRPATTTSEKDVQAVVVQERYDVEAQSGILDKSRSIQTDAVVADIVPMMTVKRFDVEVQSGILDDSHGVQTEIQMKASMPKRYDVETQSGIREKPEWCQTELELRKASKVFDTEVDATMWPDMRDYVLETESVPEVELVAPMQHARPPINVDDKGMQTFIRSTTYDVEVQSGIVEYSRGAQTETQTLAAESRKSYVATQTDMELREKAAFFDSVVDATLQEEMKDYLLETESIPAVELMAPVQHARPPVQQKDKGIQASMSVTTDDVTLRSVTYGKTEGVQTEWTAESLAPKKFHVAIQSGITNQTEWTQTITEHGTTVVTSRANVHAALQYAYRDYTCETDTPLEITGVERVRMAPTWTSKEEMGVQAEYVSTRYDVQLQSGIRTRADETQTDDFLDVQVYAPVRSVRPATTTSEKDVQAVVVQERYDVEAQSGILDKSRSIQTDAVVADIVPMMTVKRFDVEVQSGILDDSHGVQTEIQMKASMPKRYDVETQSGIREKPEWCQTELELRKASKVFDTVVDATMWPDMRDYVLETESVPEVELVAPMQHARPPINVDDKGMQTFIRSTTYDVEVQSGLIEYSRGMQTDLASMVVSGKKYDVAVQSGICSRAELCQTDMEFKTKAQVRDAEVDASMLHVRNDYVLETESSPELELVAPMQHAQPATQTDDKGVQAFTRSVLYDVEVQSGLVDYTQGVQTEAQSAAVALRKFDVELQSGIRDKSEWCQTDVGYRPVVETQDAEVDAALDTASRDYTLETDALLEVQVAQPVLASRAYIDKEDIGLQAAMVPARFDVELQSGVTTAEGKTQVDELLKPEVSVSNRSVQTAVESVSPVFNKKLQVCLSPIPVDAILQSDDAVMKDLSATVQREPLKKVDIGLQTVVSDRTEWCQADLGLRTKVEVMDVGVDASMRHVRSDYLFETESLPAVELVAPIQHAGPPTQMDDKSMQAFIRAATFDVIAQSGLVSTSRGAQTDAAPMAVLAKKFDVETQSGICSKAELCQTDMEFKTKAQVRDAEVDASMLHVRNDYVLETESSPELESVAPMQHAQPATQTDDKGVQAFTRSVLYDVEVQSGIIDYSRGVQTEAQSAAVALRKLDVELQSGIRDKSEWCQTDVGYRPVVETQDAEVDAALDTASRDYTLETDALLEVQVAQPVLASRAYIDKEDIGLQAAMVPARFDVELQSGVTTAEGKTQVDELLKPEVSVSNRSVQTAVESVSPVFNKKLQVCLSPIPVDAILQSDDAVMKDLSATVQREPLKKVDIGLQTVVSDRTECCQVDLGLRTKVEVMDVGVDASMRHVRSDYLFETESLPAVELVAPIQHAGPPTQTDDKSMQAFIRAATFDVIAQSGLVSTSRGAQTDAAPMAVLAKKFDVETQSGICSKAELCQTDMELRAMKDYVLETDSLPEVELVAPIEHAAPPIQVDDKCIQAVGGVVLYDAELQSGVTTSIGVTQVDEFLKPKVSVSGRSVQTDDQSPLSVLNKKLQVRLNPIPFDVTVQSDDVPMMDFSALVQQAALKKFDVEAQAGLMYTSECSQTDMVFKSKVDVLDAEVDACMRPAMGDYVLETDSLPEIELVTPVQLARPPAQLDDKSVQVSSRAVVYDVELQAGVTTSNSVTQVDDDLLRLQVPISGRSVQTDVESAVLPVVNKKLQVCINPIPVDSTFDAIEDFRSGYGAGLSRVPRIDVGLQCAISPRLFDVELQSGSTQSTVASQTEADRYVSSAVAFGVEPVSSFAIPVDCVLTTDAPPDPIVIPSIQSSTSRPALSAVNKKLQVSLDHHQVSSINQASQCEEVAKHPVINSNLQVNLRSERSEASTQFVDMLEKAQAPVPSAKISTSTSVAVQCDRRQSYRDASTHSELFAISKGELQHMEAKPIVEMTTKASHYYGDTSRILVPTQVTTVSYQSVQSILSHSSQRLVDAYCEVMYPTSVIQVDTQSQALSQPRESTIITLDKTATSYVQPHSAEFISAAPISSAPKAPILVDSNFGFTHAQKNKKCQINLLDGSSARSQMLNKKLQTQVRQEDASCECMLVDSRSSPITPAGQTEAQVQATPYSLNKKLQVKIQPTTTVSATLTECASVEVRLQPIGSRVSTRDAGVMSEPLGAQQVWTQCAEVFEPTSVPMIKAEAGHVEEVLDMPIARSEASAETLAALEPVVSRGRVHAMLEQTPTPTVTQLVTKGSSFQSERLETAHKMFSPLYTQTQLQLEVPRSDEWSQTVGAEPELESIRRSPVPQTRHVRIQKGSSWLVSRQQDVEVQASPLTSTEVEIRLTDLIQGAPRIDVPDSGEAGVTKPHGSRPSSTTSPTGSIRGLRYPRQEAVNWGVQCTPLTLNGVTQTSDLTRTESGSDISDHSTTAVRRPKHYGGTSVGLQTSFDDEYTIKRVVTTIARRGNVSVHKRSTPVVRYMHARGRPSLLTTSLPSHLDEQLLAGAEDDESEDGYETPTTAKVTTFSVDGERRVVRDDLHFGPRGRGRSLDSRLGPHSHLGGSDIYESDLADMHDEIHMQSQAEMYFDRLLRTWGAPYLLSRLSRRGSAMSVDRDVNGTDGSRLARLIGVKTQYTSTGNLAAYYQGGGNTRTTETQTAGLLPQGRPPHRNKRIQRGQSYISWTPGQAPVPVAEISPTVGESPLGYTQQHATPSFGFSSTYTETIRERVATCGRMDDYVCPNCGYHAHLPQYRPGSMSTVQPLPITQLRNVTCQTAEMGVDAIDPIGQTLPIYITDEDLMHINPRQHFSEDRLLSKVTWCEAGGSLKVGDSSSSSHLVDEVWIDSPGKLLEVHTTGVVIPGSDRVISAAEAFYRGILRVIYWDYTKAAPSSMLLAESGIVTPIADAVVADLVRLACYSPERVMMGKTDRSALSINTHVVWTTPEKHRTRYAVHAVRPEGERQGASYSVASAFAAGYIRKDDGQLALRHPMYADVGYETGVQSLYSDTVEKISVQEAIVRGILDVELIATDSPSVRAQMATYEKTPYRSDYSSHDVDV